MKQNKLENTVKMNALKAKNQEVKAKAQEDRAKAEAMRVKAEAMRTKVQEARSKFEAPRNISENAVSHAKPPTADEYRAMLKQKKPGTVKVQGIVKTAITAEEYKKTRK